MNESARAFILGGEYRLIEVNQGSPFSGALRSTFAYDGLGRLRIRTEYLGNGSSWNPVSTNACIYDGIRVIQERDSSNTPSVSYTRGTDLSGSLEGAGGIGGLLARSAGYSCSDSMLTVSITNESSIDCIFWIYSDAGTNVDGEAVSAGSARTFTFSAVGGVQYTVWGTDSRWHALTIFNEWTPTLDHHRSDLGGEGDNDPEDYIYSYFCQRHFSARFETPLIHPARDGLRDGRGTAFGTT